MVIFHSYVELPEGTSHDITIFRQSHIIYPGKTQRHLILLLIFHSIPQYCCPHYISNFTISPNGDAPRYYPIFLNNGWLTMLTAVENQAFIPILICLFLGVPMFSHLDWFVVNGLKTTISIHFPLICIAIWKMLVRKEKQLPIHTHMRVGLWLALPMLPRYYVVFHIFPIINQP